jgi:hypothetical protein
MSIVKKSRAAKLVEAIIAEDSTDYYNGPTYHTSDNLVELKKKLKDLDFACTGNHWWNGLVERTQEELLKTYPKYAKLINKYFEIVADINYICNEIEEYDSIDRPLPNGERALAFQHKRLEKLLK